MDSMVKAANLSANIDRLLSHELYYRSKGEIGERLSQAELTSTYDNLSVWLWNDEQYEFNPNVQDELGFERAVEMLNCYTSNAHQGGNVCGQDTREQLAKWSMITESGELNPSYPLNWMEKPLTRMMLGRSYWDLEISVDTTGYQVACSVRQCSERCDSYRQQNRDWYGRQHAIDGLVGTAT